MPRFNVTIEFGLTTEIEPDFGYTEFGDESSVEDYQDNSYFGSSEVSVDGGSVSFVLEADSEEEAYEKAAEVINEGQEAEDRNGLTWLLEGINVEVEEIIVPMDLERAKTLLFEWLGEREDDELTEAIGFLLSEFDRLGEKIAELGREVAELSYKLSAAERKAAELAGEIDRLKNGPDGSEAPTEYDAERQGQSS